MPILFGKSGSHMQKYFCHYQNKASRLLRNKNLAYNGGSHLGVCLTSSSLSVALVLDFSSNAIDFSTQYLKIPVRMALGQRDVHFHCCNRRSERAAQLLEPALIFKRDCSDYNAGLEFISWTSPHRMEYFCGVSNCIEETLL